jgi:hypothetical protein
MTYRLRDDVYYCVANRQVALLDLPADRYYCLPPQAEAAFRALIQNKASDELSSPSLATLFSRGLLVEDKSGKSVPPPHEITYPAVSLVDARSAGLKWSEAAASITRRLQASAELKRAPLDAIVRRIRLRKLAAIAAMKRIESATTTERKIISFLSTAKFLSTRDQCLSSSIALIDYLASARCYPDLVIGVRMKPFSAHAWVQQGDIVLNDEVDAILPYTPILVV